MSDEDCEMIRNILSIVALAVVVLVVLFLVKRPSLNCIEDQCRELKAKAIQHLATVLGDSFGS